MISSPLSPFSIGSEPLSLTWSSSFAMLVVPPSALGMSATATTLVAIRSRGGRIGGRKGRRAIVPSPSFVSVFFLLATVVLLATFLFLILSMVCCRCHGVAPLGGHRQRSVRFVVSATGRRGSHGCHGRGHRERIPAAQFTLSVPSRVSPLRETAASQVRNGTIKQKAFGHCSLSSYLPTRQTLDISEDLP